MWKCLARMLCASLRFDVVNSLYFPLKEIAVVARHVCRDKFIGADRTHRSTYRIFGSTSGSLGLTQTHTLFLFFFYKNILYKNIEAEICAILRIKPRLRF